MKFTVEDYINQKKQSNSVFGLDTMLLEDNSMSLAKAISYLESNERDEINNLVNGNPILKTYNDQGNLIMEHFEQGKDEYKKALIDNDGTKNKADEMVKEVYNAKKPFADIIKDNLKAFSTENNTAYNTDLAKLASNRGSKLTINIFPNLKNTQSGLERTEHFDKQNNTIVLCPMNYNKPHLIPSIEVGNHFAHELGHNNDYNPQTGEFASPDIIQNAILNHYGNTSDLKTDSSKKRQPKSKQSIRDDISEIIKNIAKNVHKDFYDSYKLDNIFKKNGNFNKDASFHSELIAFISEKVHEQIVASKGSINNFTERFELFSKNIVKKSVDKKEGKPAFVADLLYSCTKNLFHGLDQIPEIGETRNVLEQLKKRYLKPNQNMGLMNQLYQQPYQQGNDQNQQLAQEPKIQIEQNSKKDKLVEKYGDMTPNEIRDSLYKKGMSKVQVGNNKIGTNIAKIKFMKYKDDNKEEYYKGIEEGSKNFKKGINKIEQSILWEKEIERVGISLFSQEKIKANPALMDALYQIKQKVNNQKAQITGQSTTSEIISRKPSGRGIGGNQ